MIRRFVVFMAHPQLPGSQEQIPYDLRPAPSPHVLREHTTRVAAAHPNSLACDRLYEIQ